MAASSARNNPVDLIDKKPWGLPGLFVVCRLRQGQNVGADDAEARGKRAHAHLPVA